MKYITQIFRRYTIIKDYRVLKLCFFFGQMEEAHCQQALCGPSRISLLTSRLPQQMQVLGRFKKFSQISQISRNSRISQIVLILETLQSFYEAHIRYL